MIAILQAQEMLIIGAIIMVLFGSTQIPKLARSLGQAQKEFKAGLDENEMAPENKTEA